MEMVRGTGQRLGKGVVKHASAVPRRKPAILPSLLACDLATLANEANRVCPEKTDYVSLCPLPARAAARQIERHGRKTGGLWIHRSHRRPVRGHAAWWHRQCTGHVGAADAGVHAANAWPGQIIVSLCEGASVWRVLTGGRSAALLRSCAAICP